MKGSFKDYLDSAIFTLLGLHSPCLFISLMPSSQHFSTFPSSHPKSSHLDYPRCGGEKWRVFREVSLTPSPPNLARVHDTNTETDISSPASLHDIYHCAS